jgi:hypothetical protein
MANVDALPELESGFNHELGVLSIHRGQMSAMVEK